MENVPWLQVIGNAYVILALDLAAFVSDDSLDAFQQIKGQKFFDQYLEKLPQQVCQGPFSLSEEYKKREQSGYGFGIFNRVLAEDNFAPTYAVRKDKIEFPPHLLDNVQFKDRFLPVWKRWDFHLRVSSNGIVTLILHLDIPKYREIELAAQDVMGLHYYFDMANALERRKEFQANLGLDELSPTQKESIKQKIDSIEQLMAWVRERSMNQLEDDKSPVVWQMAVDVMMRWIQTIDGCISLNDETGTAWRINLNLHPRSGTLREIFTTYILTSIRDRKNSSSLSAGLSPHEILSTPAYQQIIAAVTEGALLHGRKDYTLPAHNPQTANDLMKKNLATWDKELCVITDKSALIYYRPLDKQKVAFSSREVSYEDYWLTILRLMEFGLEVKMLALLLEKQTANALVSRLSRKWQTVGGSTTLSVDDISAQLLNISRLLAHTRSLSSAPIVGQASYAIRKYEFLLTSFGVPEILAHAETNLKSMSRLLERKVDLDLQFESQIVNETALAFSMVFASVSLIMGILAFPSFIADWINANPFLTSFWLYPYFGQIGVGIMTFLVVSSITAFVFAVTMFVRLRRKRSGSGRW